MRLYQAGPMRGLDNYGFQQFEDGMRYLQWLGHNVVSPHEIDIDEQLVHCNFTYIRDWEHGQMYRLFSKVWANGTLDIAKMMRRDIEEILSCDAISFLPGSDRSEGARVERVVAEAIGLKVYVHAPFLYFHEEPKQKASAFGQAA